MTLRAANYLPIFTAIPFTLPLFKTSPRRRASSCTYLLLHFPAGRAAHSTAHTTFWTDASALFSLVGLLAFHRGIPTHYHLPTVASPHYRYAYCCGFFTTTAGHAGRMHIPHTARTTFPTTFHAPFCINAAIP